MPRTATEALALNRHQAFALADRVGGAEVQRLLSQAAFDLRQRLEAKAPTANTPTTAREMRATLDQVQQVSRELAARIGRATLNSAVAGAQEGAQGLVDYLQGAHRQFGGAGRSLGIREASLFSRSVAGARASVLRSLATTPAEQEDKAENPDGMLPELEPGEVADPWTRRGLLSRYTLGTIGEFESVLQRGIVTGKPWAEVREEITGASPFLQGAPRSWAERIVRTECLLADTPVSGAVVRAVFRRWYEGDVVEVVTESGRKFTATPNHPMLTRSCWVGAGDLCPGDDLVCYAGQQDSGAPRDEDVQRGPTTIGEIFDSLAAVGVGERRPTAEPDFHGDGSNGEVEVFRPDRMLRIGKFAPLHEPVANQIFSPSGMGRASFCRKCGRLLSIQKQPCFCGRSDRDFEHPQTSRDCLVVDPEIVREAFDALSGAVLAHDRVDVDVISRLRMLEREESISCGSRSTPRRDAGCAEGLDHESAGDLQRVSHASGAHPGEIKFDRVVSVHRRRYSGYVFNLETPYGYFAINGAYTGNTMAALNRSSWEGIRAADDELGDMVKILCATIDGRTGWDSLQVHGQIRRPDEAFEWNGGFYQNPPNRPNDREVVVPHRISWPIPDELHPRSDAEVVAAWQRDRRKGSPPARAERSTVPLDLFGKSPKRKEERERDQGGAAPGAAPAAPVDAGAA